MRTRKEEVVMANMIHNHLRKLNWKEDRYGFCKTHARVGEVYILVESKGFTSAELVRVSVSNKDFRGFFPKTTKQFDDRLKKIIEECDCA